MFFRQFQFQNFELEYLEIFSEGIGGSLHFYRETVSEESIGTNFLKIRVPEVGETNIRCFFRKLNMGIFSSRDLENGSRYRNSNCRFGISVSNLGIMHHFGANPIIFEFFDRHIGSKKLENSRFRIFLVAWGPKHTYLPNFKFPPFLEVCQNLYMSVLSYIILADWGLHIASRSLFH